MSAVPWVVFGGAVGESAHCQRCGEGLRLRLPVKVATWIAVANAFADAHADCVDTGRIEPETNDPMAWLAGRDTGTSSRTIWYVMMQQTRPIGERADYPWDPADFGRCYRLLKLFPPWRDRLPEVAAAYPTWGPLVREWNRLEALYEEELPTGRAPRLYETMQDLIKEGSAAA